MADNKKWFKVWTTILLDEEFEDLSDDLIGKWTRLGARIALIGKAGVMRFKSIQKLMKFLKVDSENKTIKIINELPNVSLKGKNNVKIDGVLGKKGGQKLPQKSEYGEITVTFDNWKKYQEDTTAAEH